MTSSAPAVAASSARSARFSPDPPATEILFAVIDPDEIARGKLDFDVVGHYARPDVFRLIVDEAPKPPVSPAQ